MPPWAYDFIHPVNRWLHIVSTALLVGGTFFYEVVVPIAIRELREPQQLDVFAKARWVFRWVVRVSVVLLTISGAISLWRMWPTYRLAAPRGYPQTYPWVMAHIFLSAIAMVIALMLTTGARPPLRPIRWMRLNLVIMLLVIFLASLTRHIRLTIFERQTNFSKVYSE